MLLTRTIEKHEATSRVTYEFLQTDVVGMGPVRAFSYTIKKITDGNVTKHIIHGVKNKDVAYTIWEDVKRGIQK